MKTLFINILIFLALVLVFDTISFWLLPAGYVSQFRDYRRDPQPEVVGHNIYPRHYFVKHPQRGFDIGTNRQTDHWVDGVTYPIWSNSIGCFDKELPGTIPMFTSRETASPGGIRRSRKNSARSSKK